MSRRLQTYLRISFVVAFLLILLPEALRAGQSGEKQDCAMTPLVAAIHNRDTQEAKRLIDSGVDLNTKSFCGSSALLESIVYDQLDVTESLLEHGANPNFGDGTGATGLSVAAFYCRQEAALLLLTHGADVNAVQIHGYTPLMDSTQNCTDGSLTALLIRAGAKVNQRTKDSQTALHVAAFYGNENAVHLLVAAGADIYAKTDDGQTAAMIAHDRDVGRKPSHDRIYEFLRQTERLSASRKQ